MGIQGLLQFIKDASEPVHVRKYRGQAVAVDTYCWLHKGAIACAEKLAKGEPTDKYVGFCMKFVNMLLSHGIKPVLVFDGCTLPSKKEVEKSRRERRQANLLKGKQLLREGKVSEARDCFARCVNITHAMAHRVINAARAQGVDCLVAPYEADAQLAYLNKAGMVQAIVTEDSDLLAFGCKKVILKMDQFGNGLEIDQARLGRCRQLGDVFTEEKFRYMCILSGCDYLPSLRGIGLAKACKALRLANNPDVVKVIKKIGHYLKMNITVPEDYIEGFIRANNTFLYQLVFDPVRRKLVPLNAYADDIDPAALSYAGRYIDDSIALQIALGNKDVNTLEQIDDYSPDAATPAHSRSRSWDDRTSQKPSSANSIWHGNYRPGLGRGAVPGATRLKEGPSTAGREQATGTRGLRLPRRPAAAKRPRSEELSEGDLLGQYSLSFAKKTKEEEEGCEGGPAPASPRGPLPRPADRTPPATRNKFAAFLQRKNQQSGAVVVPGTRSRFFCNSLESMDWVSKTASPQPLHETAVTDRETSLGRADCLGDKKAVDLNESDCHQSKELVDLNQSDCLERERLVDLNESDCLDDKGVDLNQSDCTETKKLADLNESGCLDRGVDLNQSDCLDDKGVDLNQSDCLDDKGVDLNQSDCLDDKGVDLNQSDCIDDKGVDLNQSDCLDDKGVDLNQSDCTETKKLGDLNEPGCLEGQMLAELNESNCLESKGLVERNAAHNPRDQTPEGGAAAAAGKEPRPFKTIRFTKTISPPPPGALRSCFSWSGSLGGFSRTPSPSPRTALRPFRRSGGSPGPRPESGGVCGASQGRSEGDGAHPWSSPSPGSAGSSPHSVRASTLPRPPCEGSSPEVPGLYKSSSLDSLSTTKIKPLAPARASGLSRRPARAQKRKHHSAHHNAENKPGMQTKIHELWKNFGFKKDPEKLPSCKKPEPLSPAKDNIQLTPETEEDASHRPERARAQRAIFH